MADEGQKTGLNAAVAQTVDTSTPPVAPAEQLDLLAPLPPDAPELAPATVELLRRRGRPVGSGNKSTAEWRDFLLARYRSPLIVMAETMSMPLEDLAAWLKISLKEALYIRKDMAKELAPYLHQKQPIAIDGSGIGLVNLIIAAPGAVELQTVHEAGGPVVDGELVNPEKSEG